MEGDLEEENLRGEAEEALVQIYGKLIKEAALEKGEPKTVRSAKHWLYDLQVFD